MFNSIGFFCYYSVIEINEIQTEKYNVKLMNNKKGYLNSFKNELGEKFIFLGFKSEFTKEEMKEAWNLLKRFKVNS